jgi:PPP family 3-phenylpropionic acid transporter
MLPYWRLSAYYFFYFAFIGAFSPYFGLYLESLRFSAFDIGVLMSLMQVMRVVAPNVWGWLAERSGSRMPIVRLAAAASVLAFLGLFGTSSFGGVFLALATLAFFWGAALPLVETVTLSHLDGESGRYGKIRVWGSIGFVAAVLGCGYLLDVAPPAALLWVSLALLVGILGAAVLVPERGTASHAADVLRLTEILRRREVAGLLAACFFMSAAHGALYVFYSIFLVDHGYSKALVGWLWTLGVVAEIVVFLVMPRLQAAVSLRAILLASFACAVLRFLLIGWGVGSLAVLVFAQVLHGATFGAYHAASVAAINRWFPGRHQARGQALYSSLSFGAGGMLGAVASGFAWERIGASLTYSLSSAFALVGLGLVVLAWQARSSAFAAPH